MERNREDLHFLCTYFFKLKNPQIKPKFRVPTLYGAFGDFLLWIFNSMSFFVVLFCGVDIYDVKMIK